MEEYLELSQEAHGYNPEQALGMLFWHKNIDKAVEDLPNFTPVAEDWTDEDKLMFQKAFHIHKDNISGIRELVMHYNLCLIFIKVKCIKNLFNFKNHLCSFHTKVERASWTITTDVLENF